MLRLMLGKGKGRKEMSEAELDRHKRIDNEKAHRKLKSLRYSTAALVMRDASIFTPEHYEFLGGLIKEFDKMMAEYAATK